MSTTFPRDVMPVRCTWPSVPGPLAVWGQTGKGQTRATAQQGRSWEEYYGPLKLTDATTRSWLAKVLHYWRTAEVLDVYHPTMTGLLGTWTTSSALAVAGASQTGTSLVLDGFDGGATVLAGDIFRIAGLNYAQEAVANATAAASGTATIVCNPGLFVGASPADNAAVTCNSTVGNVLFRCILAEEPTLPTGVPPHHFIGLKLVFREFG